MGLAPGDRIAHYRILELIGINLGAVYRAHDRPLARQRKRLTGLTRC